VIQLPPVWGTLDKEYNIEDAKEWYGAYYHSGEGRDKGWHGLVRGYWEDNNRWQKIAGDIVGLLHPKTILELGCGRGSLVKALRDIGVDAHGIDISEWAINNPMDESIKPFLQCIPAQDFPIDKKYDAVIGFDIIEHLPYDFYDKLFSNIKAVTDILLVTVPSGPDDGQTHSTLEPVNK